MFFKGASQCCTPVSVKGPGLCRLLLSLSVCVCVHLKLIITPLVLPAAVVAAGLCMYACGLCFM